MKVDHQMVRGGFTCRVVVKLNALLIVSVDEIDLDTSDTPRFKNRKRFFLSNHYNGVTGQGRSVRGAASAG